MLEALREKCPNTEIFLVRIFLFSENYGPEKSPYLDTFQAAKYFRNITA